MLNFSTVISPNRNKVHTSQFCNIFTRFEKCNVLFWNHYFNFRTNIIANNFLNGTQGGPWTVLVCHCWKEEAPQRWNLHTEKVGNRSVSYCTIQNYLHLFYNLKTNFINFIHCALSSRAGRGSALHNIFVAHWFVESCIAKILKLKLNWLTRLIN